MKIFSLKICRIIPFFSWTVIIFIQLSIIASIPITKDVDKVSTASDTTQKMSPQNLCSCNDQICSCGSNQITNVSVQIAPVYCSPTITSLFITNANISHLDKQPFANGACTNLEKLSLRNTGIRRLTNESFELLSNVQILNIGHNKFEDYKKNIFRPMNSLKTLIADNNPVYTLKNGTFNGLKMLQNLNLSSNKIGYIDIDTFLPTSSLDSLSLDNNIIVEINGDTFKGLGKLKFLNLEQNPIKSIKQDSFHQLPMLKTLLISIEQGFPYGGIDILSEAMFISSSHLITLNVTNLRIRQIKPSTFAGLSSLRTLSLQYNYLINIESHVFSYLKNLHILDLSFNLLRCLTSSNFGAMTQLQVLDLSRNDITYISNDAFKNLNNLLELRLDRNPIHKIESSAFCSLSKLKFLHFNVQHLGVEYSWQHNDKYAKSPFAKLKNFSIVTGLPSGNQQGLSVECQSVNLTITLNGTACPLIEVHFLETSEVLQVSSKYLLIVISICILFFLIATGAIMGYRAWSKTKDGEDDKEVGVCADHQELLTIKDDTIPASITNATSQSPTCQPLETKEGSTMYYNVAANGQGSPNGKVAIVSSSRGPPLGSECIEGSSGGSQDVPLAMVGTAAPTVITYRSSRVDGEGNEEEEEEATLTTFGLI